MNQEYIYASGIRDLEDCHPRVVEGHRRALVLAQAGLVHATVVSYPGNPAAGPSSTKSMTAGGVNVPVRTEMVNYGSGTKNYDVAKFTLSSAATVVVTSTEAVTSYSITPLARNITGSTSGNTLTFTLAGLENLVIHINSQADLILLATTPETENLDGQQRQRDLLWSRH